MLIKEYRISLPMSVEEYRIAQLYMIQKKSREETSGAGSGVEIIENKPYFNGPGGNGQYTYKIYHIGSHLPGWFRAILPKSALQVEEEAWNAYPYTKTRYRCPFVEKFLLEVETKYLPDAGEIDNTFSLTPAELRQRTIDYIDIVKDPISSGDYRKEEDPKLYVSRKTGRGPLAEGWREEYSRENAKARTQGKPPGRWAVMTAYKLCKVEFRYWGMQSKIERFIHDIALRKTMLRAHRQAWSWQDEWYGLTLEDIRRLEAETQQALAAKMADALREHGGGPDEEEAALAAARKPSLKGDNSLSLASSPPRRGSESQGATPTGHLDRTLSSESSSTLVNGQLPSDTPYHPRAASISTSRSTGSCREAAGWRVESLEQLQESSSDEDEFFDAKEGMEATMEEGAVGHMVRASSMDIVSSGDESYADCVSTLAESPEESNFGRRVEQFRQMYSMEVELPSGIEITPPSSASACKTKVLFLVLHGGSVLESSNEPVSKQSDFTTMRASFDTVIQSHYPSAMGQVAFRMVRCPHICSDTLKILSSLSPFKFNTASAMSEPSLAQTQDFVPLGAIALFASSSPEYQEHVSQVVAKANQVHHDFLLSEDGRGFTGQVCLLADSTGSLMAYDALTRSNQHFTRGGSRYGSHTSLEGEGGEDGTHNHPPLSSDSRQLSHSDPDLGQQTSDADHTPQSKRSLRSKSEVAAPDTSELERQGSGKHSTAHLSVHQSEGAASRRTSSGSHFEGMSRFDFEVSEFFMFGCPLGLVLAYRRMFAGEDKNCPPTRPACHQVYNMFHSNDPSAIRLEPLVHPGFSCIPPVHVSRFSKFPYGNGESIHVVETIQNHLSLFTDTMRQSASPAPHGLLRRQSSQTSINSTTSGLGEATISSMAQVTRRWWGSKRLDYLLYCPEVLHSFPTNALPHLFHASFWESTDVVAFILRQIMRLDGVAADAERVGRAVLPNFTITQPREKWLRRRTTIKVRNLQPNHRANDVMVLEDSPQVLTAKFMYGSLDIACLSGEKVDVYLMKQPPNGEWTLLGTEVTDSHGRLTFTVPGDQRVPQGMYPVKMVVRGDHTSVDFFLAVLPPKTETVVFSVDGSFTASVSIMGKDPKVRAGSVDVVRHWQELGFLILYVTARPDMQHKKVVRWLAQHNFPHGMVAFMDGLSKEPLRQKLQYLKNLQTEAQVQFKAAYGSNKDIFVYKELGLTPQQIFVVGKASKKQHTQAEVLSDGYAVHLNNLSAPGVSRPAVGNARMFLRKSCFSLPASHESKKITRRTLSFPCGASSSNSSDQLKHLERQQSSRISSTAAGTTIVHSGNSDLGGGAAPPRGKLPGHKMPTYDTQV